MYTQEAKGYYAYFGRNHDLIKPGGIWVGQRDTDGWRSRWPSSSPGPGARSTPDALLAHCRESMAAFKRPRRIVVVDELPKTATGKVRRFALRDALATEVSSEPG